MICNRKIGTAAFFSNILGFFLQNILGGSLHNFIPPTDLVKAKSDTSIASSVASELCGSGACSRSRSLEAITGLPMWSDTITIVELVKGDRGLGFSVLDYQVMSSARPRGTNTGCLVSIQPQENLTLH